MKIEVLFPEIANLYGDLMNVKYLEDCIPDAEIIHTSLQMKPRFVDEEVDLVYMGTTTEQGQLLALEKLMPYRDAILKRIEEGGNFLNYGLYAYQETGSRSKKAASGHTFAQYFNIQNINCLKKLYLRTYVLGPGMRVFRI